MYVKYSEKLLNEERLGMERQNKWNGMNGIPIKTEEKEKKTGGIR